MSPRASTRRGFVLVEMLFAILLIGVVAVIAARLFASTVRVYRQTTEATTRLRAQQQWLATMREDAWAATEIEADDAATFALADGAARWSSDGEWLTRSLDDDVRRWPLSRPLRWHRDGRQWIVSGDVDVPLATPSLHAPEAP